MQKWQRGCAAIGALLAVLALGFVTAHAATTQRTASSTSVDRGTPVDAAINAAVERRIAAGNLSQAGAAIYREQLQIQFGSLAPVEQRRITSAVHPAEPAPVPIDIGELLSTAIRAEARQALAAAKAAEAAARPPVIRQKLGTTSTDNVFVATAGPCRVTDSRSGPGSLAAGTARQIYVMDTDGTYDWSTDQGGTGTSTTGNCVGSSFPATPYPVSVVAIVTVVNTTSTGALQAWNGNETLSAGAVVVWNPGGRATNTTVIPIDRLATAYPDSGFKRDLAVYNNSDAAVDYVIDVVGYFIVNSATMLDCHTVSTPSIDVPGHPGGGIMVTAKPPACESGYTQVFAGCAPSSGLLVLAGTSAADGSGFCYYYNPTATTYSFKATGKCCRIPGR